MKRSHKKKLKAQKKDDLDNAIKRAEALTAGGKEMLEKLDAAITGIEQNAADEENVSKKTARLKQLGRANAVRQNMRSFDQKSGKLLTTLKKLTAEKEELLRKEMRDIAAKFMVTAEGDKAARILIEDIRKMGRPFSEMKEYLREILIENTPELFGTAPLQKHIDYYEGKVTREELVHFLSIEVTDMVLKTMESLSGGEDALNSAVEKIAQTAIWNDANLTTVGRAAWAQTYALDGTDEDAHRFILGLVDRWLTQVDKMGYRTNLDRTGAFVNVGWFAARWAIHAFQRISTSHTYASALMCTDADKMALTAIEPQWSSFMVVLPDGLFSHTDSKGVITRYTRILVNVMKDASFLILLNQNPDDVDSIVTSMGTTLAETLDVKNEKFEYTENADDATVDVIRRLTTLAKRLVAGLLLALQENHNFKSRDVPAKRSLKGRAHDEPSHRIVFVGAPLKIDCRPAVRDFIAHGSPKRKGAPPAVQFVVRGHYRQQVCGAGRLLRKTIWIQPFWKGSEDAPILTRPKHLEG